MHTGEQTKKRRTLLLLVLFFSAILLFDALMLINRQEPQTYQSKAEIKKQEAFPISQNVGTSGYLIDELFDVSDEDHAVILDEFVKELAQNEKDLNEAGSQLGSTLGTDDYVGAYQALANLQKGLGHANINFSAAARLLDYHLEATSSATPTPVMDNPNNKVLGVGTGPNTVAQLEQQVSAIENGDVKQLMTIKTSIQNGRKYLNDQLKRINDLMSANNLQNNQQFCDKKTGFLTELANNQAILAQNIADAKTKQQTAIKSLDDIVTAILLKMDLIDSALGIKKTSSQDKLQLIKDKSALGILKNKIADLQLLANDPVINNVALETSDSITVTTINTIVNLLCQGLEENQVRQALNKISTDLTAITNDAGPLTKSVQTINGEIISITAQIPVIDQNDNKDTILFKLHQVSNLLIRATAITSKIASTQATFEGLKTRLNTIKTAFSVLQNKYSTIATLMPDITRVGNEIQGVQTSLDMIQKDIEFLSTALQNLINALNQLSSQLGTLFQGISEELKKPPEEENKQEKGKKEKIEVNKYCSQQDSDKNDDRIYRDEDLNCVGKIIGDACGGYPELGKFCRRVGVERKARKVAGIPVYIDLLGTRVGISRKTGVVCACKKDNPNQKLVSIGSWFKTWGPNAGAVTAGIIYVKNRISGGGDGGSDNMTQGEDNLPKNPYIKNPPPPKP